ncbi:hypothetical protein B0H11DRAFT_1740370 [Mycena galericulata]|nr:hypothetical protein B0H11DRAFT_1740370 [Mycena galericulata]
MWNPYAQGGWKNEANTTAGTSGNPTLPQPSIFGALPYPTQASSSMLLSFRFTSFNPTLLDSIVMGPRSQAYFRATTDAPTVGFTVVHNSANQPMIMIEWSEEPIVEVRGIIPKQYTSKWLALSPDKRCVCCLIPWRIQTHVSINIFFWAPDGECICLFSSGLGAPQIYARVSREERAVKLELTAEVIQVCLLEICIAATLLLQSGRNID